MKIEDLLNRYYDTFSENDKYIAGCVARHPKDCIRLSIDEFAENYHVSKSALTRFAQKLKLPGYSELRSVLRLENMQEGSLEFSFKEEALKNYHKMIEYIRQTDYSHFFEKIYSAKRILIYASGYSQARAAKEFQRIFLPLHKKIYYMHGHDMAGAFENLVREEDLVILISLTGEADHMVELAKHLRLKDISTVSVTRMQMNPLSSVCGENLYIQALSLPERYQVSYEITTPYFLLIELLFIRYQQFANDKKLQG